MTHVSTIDLWSINRKESPHCKNPQIGQNVVAYMEPLMTYPFAGQIEAIYTNSALVRIETICPVKSTTCESDIMKAAGLAYRIVVPLTNIMENNRELLSLSNADQNIKSLKRRKSTLSSNISKLENKIIMAQESINENKKLTAKIDADLTETQAQLNDALLVRREIEKWRSTSDIEKVKNAVLVNELREQVKTQMDQKESTIMTINKKKQEINTHYVKIGQLKNEIDEVVSITNDVIRLTQENEISKTGAIAV